MDSKSNKYTTPIHDANNRGSSKQVSIYEEEINENFLFHIQFFCKSKTNKNTLSCLSILHYNSISVLKINIKTCGEENFGSRCHA
jgi:hypothetical protein